MLKAQDSLLALKYWSMRREGGQLAMRDLAEVLGFSASEVSKAAKRLVVSGLLVERDGLYFAETRALSEWLCFGLRYALPPKVSGFGRGMGTAWNCDLVKSPIVPPSPAFIWPMPGGEQEGVFVEPIYQSVPLAASKDVLLYQALALVDAVRLGKPRELAIARESLTALLSAKSL
ncbi:MAG TPA: helix-turn-helix domain-containing protein [Marinagarivorans sp.]